MTMPRRTKSTPESRSEPENKSEGRVSRYLTAALNRWWHRGKPKQQAGRQLMDRYHLAHQSFMHGVLVGMAIQSVLRGNPGLLEDEE